MVDRTIPAPDAGCKRSTKMLAGGNDRAERPTFPWRAASLLAAIGIVATSAHAQDATWRFAPGSSDYNAPANWTPTAAPIGPSGTASFGASGTTSLTFSTGTTVDTFQFNPGASAYTFGLNGHFLEFTGSGIVNNSSNAPTINALGLLQFDNTATAGNAIINNTPGSTTFTGFSTAGTATITNSGGGLLSFTDSSNAGSATITTNAGSLTQFSANSDGGNARFVTNAGGIVDFSSTAGFDGFNIVTTGSIAGSGQYFLGNNIVHVGGNGDSTTVSGVISACGPTGSECTAASGTAGGSLFKEGTGTLTLSGVNTYTGSTVVNGGTLLIAGAGTLGATTAQLQVLAGTLDLGGTTQVTGELSTFGGSIVNGALKSTAYTLAGGFISANLTGGAAVTQDGVGTTTLAATNTYAGGTTINSGTLEAAHASGGTIDALSSGGITINSAGALRSSVNGTLGNDITFYNGSLSAAAGTTLTLTGGIFLNSFLDSATTFGNSTDTGTVLVDPTGISASSSASIVVGGGTLRAGSFQLGSALGTIQSTTVDAGATLDLNDFSAAIHNLGGAGSVVTGTFGNTNLSLVVDPATSSEFSGVISGAGKVSVTGGGTMILSGDNTYGNGTSIMASTTLQIGNGGATGSIAGNVLDGGTLVFNRSNTITFAGVISDFSGDGPASAGSLVQNGTGTTILTANNTYTAGTTINAGTLQIGNGGTTGSVAGNVVDNATFAVNRSDAYTFSSVISGTGAFRQIGTGTTTFSAVQTYQGSTTISAGVLALTGTASIAASSGVVADAKFDISGLSAGTPITNLSGGSAGTVALGNNTLTLTNAAGTFAGVISGNGGLVKQGSGLFTLSGANDYTGATTVADGNLRINGSVASAVTVQSGATLSGIGSVGGPVTIQSGGTLSAGQSPGTITLGALNLNAGSTSVFELGSPGVVGGATNDLVNVTGNLTLGGTLSVNAPSAGYYRLFNYGTLTPSNFATITGSTSGTPTVLTNVPNQVNLSIAAAGQRIQFWDGADQTGNGVVNGSTGTWNATNTNWTGAPGQAAINDQWRSSVGVFTGTAGTITVVGTQAFDTLQFSTTGYVLNAGAGGQLQLAGLSGTGTINTDSGVVATINTPIVNGSSQSLAKVGGGTLVLTAANTYTGGTTISGGTLQLGNGGASGSIIGNVTDNAVFAINRSDLFTFGGVISGTGAFNQIGTGTTTLTNTNTYTGPTTVSAGTLTIAATGSIASNVTNNANFNNAGTVTGSLTNTGTASNTGIWNGNVQSNTGTINNNLTWTATISNTAGTFNNNAPGTVSGLVTNAGTATNSGTLNGGLSNTAGTTTNSGTINGGVTVASGTLNTTGTISGGLTNAGTVNAAGLVNGAIANNAGTFTTTGALSSNSTFTNAAGATLAVGAATYTLQGLLTNSGAVTVANGATLNATTGGVTNNAGGTITVAAGGTVKDDLNNAGAVANNGAYIANVAINTGTVTNNGVWTGNVASNAGTINNNLAWTGTIANAGTFNNNAGATVSGLLTNTAGTTTNSGALNGGANISGGVFTGSGTVANLTVSGGTFAPGNGTPGSSMAVSGNLAFQSGAMYLVTLNPTTASFASVGGTASLNGTAAAVYLAGNYISKKYTILTAAGGVSGTFGSLVNTNVPANFTSSLSYDGNNAYIDLTLNLNPAPNFGSGLNINQQNVANTLVNFFNTTGGIPLVFGTLTPAGLTQASGELGTGVIQSSIKANDMFLNLLLDPSVAGRAGGFASGSVVSQFAADAEALAYAAKRKTSPAERDAYAMATKAPYLAPQPVNRWSVWGAAYGGSATTDGNTIVGSHDTTARAYGVVGGADYKVTPDALIGFALAGGGTSFSIASALGSGSSDLFQAGVFGRQNIGAAYLSAALAYGWQDVTTNRTVTVAGTELLRANFKAETFSARFEGGYRFATPLAGITPYVAAQAISFNLPAYAEQVLAGTGTFALNYGAQTTTATRTELGLRSDKSFAMQNGIFTLRGRAAWAHDYNSDRAVGAVFQTLPGAAFVVNGARANPDGALVSAGAEMKWLNGFSLAATFEGEFSGNVTSYAGKGVARYTW
jgi:autotransporter-associated beta strand protein